MSILAK
jgi:hypothetical protein